MREVNISRIRENFADIVDAVKINNESVVIEKHKKPQAIIISYSEYKDFEEWEIQKESELMKKLLKKDSGLRYDWESVKKELFEDVSSKPLRRPKKVSKKVKR